MNEKPMTLLEMAGVSIEPSLAKSTLVLIDYQNEYRSGKVVLHEIEQAIVETSKLLQLARKADIPTIHVVHEGKKGGLFDLEATGGEIISELKPMEGERVVRKKLPNAFSGTPLHELLQEFGNRQRLIIAGLMSHMCLSTTVRSALDLGYETTVVASTTTSRDLKGVDGETIEANRVTAVSLAALQDRFCGIVKRLEDLR